jgi:FkbM family methyltransferase
MTRRRFDLLEVFLISATVAVIAIMTTRAYTSADVEEAITLAGEGVREIAPLARAYGPTHFSQFAEEWIIRDFFHDRRDGVFVDVGANDYREDSTTYYLETSLGWHGLAIDAQREYEDGYRKNRPRTKFFALFVSDQTDAIADLYIPANRPLNATGVRGAVDDGATKFETREIPTIRLDDLLTRTGVDHVDFLSVDIELAEPKALAGFDVERFKPELVCIEAHPTVRQAILDYFQRRGYVLVGKYLRVDGENLYFTEAARQ